MLKTKDMLFLIALGALVIVNIYSIYYAPYPAVVPIGDPSAYRNTYVHVPIAITTYVLFTIGFIYNVMFLVKKKTTYSDRSYIYILMGLIFASLTLAQGSIWARESWGTYWNWDPRETGVFLLWLAYLVYLGIRSSVSDREKMLRVSSVYAIAAFINVPFSFILPYVMPSLHPRVQETSKIMVGEASFLLPCGIIFASLFGIFLTEYIRDINIKKEKRHTIVSAIGISLIILMIILAIPAIAPWATGKIKETSPTGDIVVRGIVISSEVSGDYVYMDILSGDYILKAITRKEDIPIEPLVIELPEINESVLSINNHNIVVKGTMGDSEIKVKEIKVLTDDSVIINVILFGLMVASVLIYFSYGRR